MDALGTACTPPGDDSLVAEDDEADQQTLENRSEQNRLDQSPDHPFNWSSTKKWTVTLTACGICFLVGVNSTSITPAATSINSRFSVSDARFPFSFFTVTAWNAGAAIFPVFALPLLERYGVRPGYLAVAPNFATLVVCRALAGCFGGVLQNVLDGIAADLWQNETGRSLPLTCYIFALLTGVSIGPVYGGAVLSGLEWRWIFYTQLIVYGVLAVPLFFIIRETRANIVLKATGAYAAPDKSAKSWNSLQAGASEATSTAAIAAEMLFSSPVLAVSTTWSAFAFGLVFISTQSIAQVFSTLYEFSDVQTGLVSGALVVGEIIGFLICLQQNQLYALRASDRNSSQSAHNATPEARLYLSILASLLGLTGGLFMYGWSSFAHVPWIVPCVGLALEGVGIMVIVQAVSVYVTDAYPENAASAIAAVAFGENFFAAFLPLASQSMYSVLGFNWASLLLGFVALALSFAPIVLVVFGRSIRERSGK